MKLLAVVTPPSMYHVFSTWKTFWEGKFTQVSMENCGRRNVRKHMEIKNGEQYITLDISSNFGDLNRMKIISLEPKYYLGISGKGLITSLGLKIIRRSKIFKKARFAITEVSIKDISKIIKEFKDVHYEGYASKCYKHITTDSYFYLAIQLPNCMMNNSRGIASYLSNDTQLLEKNTSFIQEGFQSKVNQYNRAVSLFFIFI